MSPTSSLARLRTLGDEMVSAKYAHLECERRWLVKSSASAGLALRDPILIRDLYIDGTRLRLREMRSGDVISRKLTKKYEAAEARLRPIVTAYLDEAEFALFAALPGNWIRKTRYRVGEGQYVYSLDKFEGHLTGLELAEIEASEAVALAAIPSPAWAVREITDCAEYQGGNLAANGIPKE